MSTQLRRPAAWAASIRDKVDAIGAKVDALGNVAALRESLSIMSSHVARLVGEKEFLKRIAFGMRRQRDGAVAKLRLIAAECAECGGEGSLVQLEWKDDGALLPGFYLEADVREADCRACADIRAVIKACEGGFDGIVGS